MANKQYISIIRLFDHCDIDRSDNFNLARAKKQLQAEFSITQNGFIEIDGHTYTRHDVFEEIERPDFAERLKFHRQVWEHYAMLDLLENSNINFYDIEETFRPYTGNPAFDDFFSPYFAGPFSYISRGLLAEKRLRDMGQLLAFEDFLQADEREEAFRPLRIFLDENLRLFRNTHKENYSMMRPQIAHWIETDWYSFFNNLPHEFYEIKNDIITFLINLGVAIQKSNKSDCKKISEQLISLQETPDSLREIIVSNHAVYTGGGGSQSSSGWGSFFWIGWVIFMIIRFAASDGCGESKPKYEFKEYLPKDYWEKNKAITDSMFKKLSDSATYKIVQDTDTPLFHVEPPPEIKIDKKAH